MKKNLCIVHIGMPKTGSSTLQEVFSTSISDTSVAYVDFGVSNHSAVIYSLFSDKPEGHTLHVEMKHTKDEIINFNKKNKDILVNHFVNTNANISIISGEDIFHLNEGSINRMKDFLLTYVQKVIIVGYVRHPISFMNSAFQQLVKNHYLDNFDFSHIYPYYKSKLEKFDKVFGLNNVKLIEFNPINFPNNDIVKDFSKRFNISFDYEKKKVVNESISKELISLLFIDNKYNKINYGKNNMRVTNNLIKNLHHIGNSKFLFSMELMDTVLKINKDDYIWINERLQNGFSKQNKYYDSDMAINSEDELFNVSDETFKQIISLLKNMKLPKNMLHNTTDNIAKIMSLYKDVINDSINEFDKGIV